MIGLFNILAATGCRYSSGGFLGFPTWYQYLPSQTDNKGVCIPALSGPGDVWLIVAAVIEILLRIAAIGAVFIIIYGGIQFITAQGEPDKATQARKTITSALVGLVISIVAATIVTFVAGGFR